MLLIGLWPGWVFVCPPERGYSLISSHMGFGLLAEVLASSLGALDPEKHRNTGWREKTQWPNQPSPHGQQDFLEFDLHAM